VPYVSIILLYIFESAHLYFAIMPS